MRAHALPPPPQAGGSLYVFSRPPPAVRPSTAVRATALASGPALPASNEREGAKTYDERRRQGHGGADGPGEACGVVGEVVLPELIEGRGVDHVHVCLVSAFDGRVHACLVSAFDSCVRHRRDDVCFKDHHAPLLSLLLNPLTR